MRQIPDIQVLNLKTKELRSSISWIALRQKEPTLEKVQNLVYLIIVNRLEDEQFVECDNTLKEHDIGEILWLIKRNIPFKNRISKNFLKTSLRNFLQQGIVEGIFCKR